MAVDPRTPVVCGVAQAVFHDGAPDPVTMLADIVRSAAADAGPGERLLRRMDTLAVVQLISAQLSDPAGLVADRLGVAPRYRVRTALGGDSPQALVNDLSGRIRDGSVDVAVVCGCEALATLARSLREGATLDWPPDEPDRAPTRVVGTDRPGTSDTENAAGLLTPVVVYPLFEHALWAAGGATLAEHRAALGRLWARFSAVAAGNPYAWSRERRSADEIATPSPANRQVTLPYTKLMNANIRTDQAAALVLCSSQAADGLGVPADRRVFPLSGAAAQDHWFVSERADLRSSPALRRAGRAALAQAGVGIDDVAHLDLYSCFPSAVQIAAAELGIDLQDDSRPPTVTGGLTFAGGPGNDYVTHSIATMVERLRGDPAGGPGLITAIGWYMTKHAVGVYSARPPARPFAVPDVQRAVDGLPARAVAAHVEGAAVGEAASVAYERDGRVAAGTITALLGDGRRALAQTGDRATLAALERRPVTGRPLRLDGRGGFELAG